MWAVEQPELELFDAAQRAEILREVFDLRRWWTLRAGDAFHTLGCALYQDGPRTTPFFHERVAASNALLLDHFRPALEGVRAFVAAQVGDPVCWRRDLPLPGFHIFGADSLAIGESHAGGHFDMQFEFAGYECEPELRVLSVTVPLQVPAGGTTLDFWPIAYQDFVELCQRGEAGGIEDAQRLYPMHQVWHVEGRPCIQRGLPLHRIGSSRSIRPDDYRITLQCHGVHDGERWILYW